MGLQTLLITQWVKMRNSGEERMTLETVFIHLRLAIYILWLVNHIWSRGLWKTYQHKSSGTVHGLLKILQKRRESLFIYSQWGCLVAILALPLSGCKCLGYHLYLSQDCVRAFSQLTHFALICPDTVISFASDSVSWETWQDVVVLFLCNFNIRYTVWRMLAFNKGSLGKKLTENSS